MKCRYLPALLLLVTAMLVAAPAFAVDVKDLWDELHAGNTLAFKQKYVGHPITVSGKLWIINGEVKPPYLSLTGTDDIGTMLLCTLSDASALLPLKKGQALTVSGTMESVGMTGMSLRPCRIE